MPIFVRRLLLMTWVFVLGASMMLQIVYDRIGYLIGVYTEVPMQLGVYNLYDHLILYRFGLGAAVLVLTPVALWLLLKSPRPGG